jgi:hypothetical protein
MRRLPVLLLAACLPPLAPAPVQAYDRFVAGLSCGLLSSSSTTDSTTQLGVVRAGPVLVWNMSDYVHVTVVCTVQVGHRDLGAPGSEPIRSRFGVVEQVGAVMTTNVFDYRATSASDVFVCTNVEVDSGKRYWEVPVDDDPATSGVQCPKAEKQKARDLLPGAEDRVTFSTGQLPFASDE